MSTKLSRKKEVNIDNSNKRKPKRKSTVPQNEDSRPERRATSNDLLRAFGPQAVGLLVGGLLGGKRGAVAGGQQGALAGASLNNVLDSAQRRTDQRSDAEFQQELTLDAARDRRNQDDVQNAINLRRVDNKSQELGQLKASNEFFDKSTNQPLIDTKQGFFVDLNGNRVDPNDVGSFKALSDEDRDANINLSRRRAAQSDIRINQADRAFEESKRNRDELTDKQLETITTIDIASKQLDQIEKLAEGISIGPIRGRVENFKTNIGIGDPKFIKFQQRTRSSLASAVRAASGTAASDAEREFINSFQPGENDTAEQLLTKTQGLREFLQEQKSITTGNLKKFQGKSVTPQQDNFEDIFE